LTIVDDITVKENEKKSDESGQNSLSVGKSAKGKGGPREKSLERECQERDEMRLRKNVNFGEVEVLRCESGFGEL